MAEIKSSLEIALERAKALGGVDRKEAAAQEGKHKGAILARRLLAEDIEPQEMAESLSEISAEGRGPARLAAAEILLDKLAEDQKQALAGLQEIARGTPVAKAADDLIRSAQAIQDKVRALKGELALELAQVLMAAGISGSAVKANPQTHPQYQKRLDEALSALISDLEKAKAAYKEALGAN